MTTVNGCDFCSKDIPSIKEYACADFTVSAALAKDNEPVQVQRMIGNWHACLECSKLIDANDRVGLANRAVDVIVEAKDVKHLITADRRKLVIASVLVCHDGFFANRLTKI